MHLQKPHTQMSYVQKKPGRCTLTWRVCWLLRIVMVVFGYFYFTPPIPVFADDPLTTQEIRYYMPDAGEVFLIWGINGWNVVPEELRPAGTSVKDAVMHTSMVRENDTFIARVQVPTGTRIDFGFLITKKRNGAEIKPVWDDGHSSPIVATEDGIVKIVTTVSLARARELLSTFELSLRFLIGVGIVFGVVALLSRFPKEYNRRTVMLLLVGLTFLGLILRLYAAWDLNTYYPDGAQRLAGDEPGYDGLARGILQDFSFNWPGRVPLYPLWLAGIYLLTDGSYSAVPYIQALLGITVIPLTYLLGRRGFGHNTGLIAALLAAISYGLTGQSLHLLSEVLYTPVLLVVTITLWDALDKPTFWRFSWAGFWIGISNLIRPTLLFFPVAIVIVCLIIFDWRRAIRYWAIYVVAAVLVIIPWIWRNYINYQAVFPLQTSNAILWQGSPEYYHLIHDQGYTYARIWTEILHGPAWDAPDPTSIEGDHWWTKRALQSIAAEPIVYLRFFVEKLATYWVGDPSADWGDSHIFDYAALRRIGFLQYDAIMVMIERMLPILALPAIFTIRHRWKILLPIFALLIYATLLHAATHAEARLSAPFQPLLLIILSGAVMATIRRLTPFTGDRKNLIKLTDNIEVFKRSNIIFFVIVVVYCVYAGLFIYRTSFVVNGERFFSLFDDAMISMRYAKNLVAGNGLVWNPGGERVEGFTNPLWVLYMALWHLLPVSSSKTSLFIQISGALFLTLNLFVIRKIASLISNGVSTVCIGAVLLTAFYLPLNNWGLQGMEVSVLALVTSFAVWQTLLCLQSSNFSVQPYLLLGVATLVRIDMAIPFVATLIFLYIADRENRRKHLAFGLGVLISFLLLQTLFRLWYFGDLLPNTYYLKMTGYPFFLRISRGLIVFFKFAWQMNLIVFAIPFLVLLFRRDKSIRYIIWIFSAQGLYSIYVGGDAWEWWGGSNRYLVIVMPVFFVMLTYVLTEIVTRLTTGWVADRNFSGSFELFQIYQGSTRQVKYGIIALIFVCLLSVNSIYGPEALGEWLLIDRPMLVLDNQWSVKMGLLINKITGDQATFATVYAGVPPYFANRFAIDLLGKNDKHIAHEDMRISSWKYTGFYPGHLKWDYDYSIGELKPDVIAQVWDLWGSSIEAKPYLDHDYTKVEIDNIPLYLRNESNEIRWDEIPRSSLVKAQQESN